MIHPLEFVPAALRKRFLWGFLIWTAASILLFFVFAKASGVDKPIPIVAFELAGTTKNALSIINLSDQQARLRAAFELGFDYFFMPAYALSFSMGLLLARDERRMWHLRLAAWMGWGVLAAALLDAVENYALWKELTDSVVSPYPELAAFCASIKFALLAAGLISILTMLASWRREGEKTIA